MLVFNFITLIAVLGATVYYGAREYFAIQAFDFEPTLPNDNLREEIRLYPSFESKLQRVNRNSYIMAIGVTCLCNMNFIMSGVHVLRDFSEGKASLTGLLSNTLLLAPRVLGWLYNSHVAHHSCQPISFFSKVAALPNTIDADWKYVPEVYKPQYGNQERERERAPAAREEEGVSLLPR